MVYAAPRHVESLEQCEFYHSMDIPGVGEVLGRFDLRAIVDEYLGHVDFDGKRVLEVGPANGYLSFEMERRGAEVVSVELADDVPWNYVPYDHPGMPEWLESQYPYMEAMKNGYWFAHRHFESANKVYYGDAHDLPDELGEFDISLLAAILVHDRDPLGIIAQCAKRTRETMIVVDQHAEWLEKDNHPIAWFLPTKDNQSVHSWWQLSSHLVNRYLEVLGFEPVHHGVHVEQRVTERGTPGTPMPHFTVVGSRRNRSG